MSVANVLEFTKSLEDAAVRLYVEKHNLLLKTIERVDLNSASPVDIAKAQYNYAQAQIYAVLMYSYYRKQQRYHEAQGRQQRADKFEEFRKDRSAADSDALSRKVEGEQDQEAGRHESNYMRWYGISQAYENAINSLKDLGKAIVKEGG